MLTMSLNQLNDDWATLTIKHQPWFEKSAVIASTGCVDGKHVSGRNTPAARKDWLNFVKKDMLGKRYSDTMKMGWNKGLAILMRSSESNEKKMNGYGELPTDHEDVKSNICGNYDDIQKSGRCIEVDFSFRNKYPSTQEDVKKILFSDEVTSMVKSGRLEEPIALLYKWGYYLTMEGCSLNWAATATSDYIKSRGYHVELGHNCEGDTEMAVHSFHRYGTKAAVNSFQTTLRRLQDRIWGVRLMTSERVDSETVGNTVVVDIGDFLPKKVKNDMRRKDGTRFKVLRLEEGEIDKMETLNRKVENLVLWVSEQKIDELLLQETVKKYLEKYELTTHSDEVGDGTDENPAIARVALGLNEKRKSVESVKSTTAVERVQQVENVGVKEGRIKNKNKSCGTTTAIMAPKRKDDARDDTNKKIDAYLELSTKVMYHCDIHSYVNECEMLSN